MPLVVTGILLNCSVGLVVHASTSPTKRLALISVGTLTDVPASIEFLNFLVKG